MPTYKWYGVHPQADVTTDAALGYPWVSDTAPQTELAAATADGVLKEVGTDKALAAAAVTTENKRKKPRPALVKKLKRISGA
jgi:hypothetical protein